MMRRLISVLLISVMLTHGTLTELPDTTTRRLVEAYKNTISANVAAQQREIAGYVEVLRTIAIGSGVDLSDSLAYTIAHAVHRDSRLTGLPASFYFGLIRVENPWLDPLIENWYGAVGLTQVVPRYWEGEFPECGNGNLYKDVYTQVCYGARVFLVYLDIWEDEILALYAYNGCTEYLRDTGSRCVDFPDWVKTFAMAYEEDLEAWSNQAMW